MGVLFIAAGVAINLPTGNLVWLTYDIALGAWLIICPFILKV